MLSNEDEKELKKAFYALDTDGNGVLTPEELKEGYSRAYPEKTEEEIQGIVDMLVEKVDINEEGVVRFTDFLVAAATRENKM